MKDLDLAHEADCLDEQHYGHVWAQKLKHFAALVRADEREQNAQLAEETVCDTLHFFLGELDKPLPGARIYGRRIATAIRARNT